MAGSRYAVTRTKGGDRLCHVYWEPINTFANASQVLLHSRWAVQCLQHTDSCGQTLHLFPTVDLLASYL